MRAPTYTAAPDPPTSSGRRGLLAPAAVTIEVGMRRLGQTFGLLVALVGCGSGAPVDRDGAADGHVDAAGGASGGGAGGTAGSGAGGTAGGGAGGTAGGGAGG